MKNALGRDVPGQPYLGLQAIKRIEYKQTKSDKEERKDKVHYDLASFIKTLALEDNMTLSFHHHLRNGDFVMNQVMAEVAKAGVKNLTICASSIFPVHAPLVALIEQKTITKIIASYISGPVADAISEGKVEEVCLLQTHGYRATSIMSEETPIDIAFIAAPACSPEGNITGSMGPSSCGVLGYAIADAWYAKRVVAVTDFLVDVLDPEIPSVCVDDIVKVDRIGDPDGIVSGTTKITRDPVGLRIAKLTSEFMKATGLLKNGFTFQTGAGGISLAVAKEIHELCLDENIKGKFASGGITSYLVKMLEDGVFEELYDVQCFELDAVESIKRNPNHHKMSAAKYADIHDPDNIVNQLDFVILGATEIDLDFNVNVTTGSDGRIMGGSGGHADTAYGAKFAIIVSKLVSSRISVVVDQVTTITTPGETVDVLVTDRGIAIHPRHQTLIDHLKATTNLPIVEIQTLYQRALALTGIPEKTQNLGRIVALSQYRDGTILDVIRQIDNVD